MKILVADDSKTTLALISESLEKLGHEVIPANGGKAAILQFQKTNPDLIILDVVMEDMDGFACAKNIRSIEKGKDWIPIIFLSASVDDASIAKGIDAGGDDYLTKPFSEITLSAKIKAMQRIAQMRNDLYKASQKLSLLSSTDSLTGIYNRLQYNKTIQEKIAEGQRSQGMFALLFLDLDGFKQVNDVFGHPVGDSLLIEVSRRLQSCLRLNDFLCRMGGDEFAIILNHIKPEDKNLAASVSKKIIQTLSSPYHLENQIIHCGSSIGIVFYPSDGADQETLGKHADIAMYHAKKSGKNNFQYYNESLNMAEPSNKAPDNSSDRSAMPCLKTSTVLSCLVNNTHICIDLGFVRKNLPLPQLEHLPNSPPYLIGLMNYRGKSVPVVDMGRRLGLERHSPYTLDTPVLLCGDGQHHIGFVVDKIYGLFEIGPKNIQKEAPSQTRANFLATITIDGILSLLVNMSYLFSGD